MPIDPVKQLLTVLYCLLFGYAAGIFYDFLRALRQKADSKAITHITDLIFCLVFFISLFVIGYTAGQGVQRFYAPMFAIVGAGMYFLGISPVLLPIFRKIVSIFASALRLILSPLRSILKKTKKMFIFLKNSFYSKKKCYTMECRRENVPKNGTALYTPQKGTANEAEKGRYYY